MFTEVQNFASLFYMHSVQIYTAIVEYTHEQAKLTVWLWICLLTDTAECTEGEVRLVEGAVESEGRVEMCVNGRWGTVCADSSWDDTDAQTVCKQMGLEGTYIHLTAHVTFRSTR